MLTPPGTCAGPHTGGRATPQHPRRRPGDFAVAGAPAVCLALALNEAEVNMSALCPALAGLMNFAAPEHQPSP